MPRRLKVTYSQIKEDERIFIKGHDGKYLMNEKLIQDLLIRLKPYANVFIKDIDSNSQVEKDYRSLVSMVTIIYQYDNSFHKIFIGHIRNLYKDIFNKILPGTIGSYIAGCLIAQDKDSKHSNNFGCSPFCAGSIPVSTDNQFCDRIVVYGVQENGKIKFNILHNPPRKNNGYVYVQKFVSLSQEEKESLSKFGLKEIILLTYEGKLIYKGLLENVPIRKTEMIPSDNKSRDLIVLGIAVIILVIAVTYYIRKSK